LTFKLDHSVSVNHRVRYLGQVKFSYCADTQYTDTDYSTWTTKVLGNNKLLLLGRIAVLRS